MKILYGVQGTGNGHTTRARMMAEALTRFDSLQVDYLFTGKDGDYFNMEPFGDFRQLPGLSFVATQGRIQYLATLKRNNIPKFLRDVRELNIHEYDLVLNDFEPVSAWAARWRAIPSVGLSHQSAFRYKVPKRGNNPIASLVLNWFAPAQHNIGFHWHHFNQPILPPMIKTNLQMRPVNRHKILVYLPFLELGHYHHLFKACSEYQFVQYHPVQNKISGGNIEVNPLSREGFLNDFSDCAGLICNAGFGACSEAIHYGKKLCVVPLQGQMEQLSNAAALEQLQLATVTQRVEYPQLQEWLQQDQPAPAGYPDVAAEIARWIVNGRQDSIDYLANKLWALTGRSSNQACRQQVGNYQEAGMFK